METSLVDFTAPLVAEGQNKALFATTKVDPGFVSLTQESAGTDTVL
jgi:hypothetical protein